MQLTDKIFKGLYRRGVMLEQMKEPALSRTVKQMEPAEPCENPRDIDALSPEEILRAAEEADIVDETDGRPLAEKLREAMGSGTMLLIDAIDDEPYVSSQMGPMLALRDQCAGGIRLAARALGTTDATVLVYRHISDSEVAIPRNIGGIPIKRVGGKYPAQCQMEEELAAVWGLRHDPPVPGRGGGPPADHHLCDGGGQLRRLPPQCGSPTGHPSTGAAEAVRLDRAPHPCHPGRAADRYGYRGSAE